MNYLFHIICILGCFPFIYYIHSLCLVMLAYPLAGIAGVVKFEKERLYEEVASDNEAMPELFKMYRDRHIKWITGACLVVAGLYAVAQGNLAPTSITEIVERDTEVNPWAGVKVSEMP